MLQRAIEIAKEAHKGQVDKGGHDYIEHPLRVMDALRQDGYDEEIQQVGVLHDVVEDTEWSLDDLRREGFSERVVQAVKGVTRVEGETYFDFIKRCKENEDCKPPKRKDIMDNLNEDRLEGIPEEDREKFKSLKDRYEKALRLLEN